MKKQYIQISCHRPINGITATVFKINVFLDYVFVTLTTIASKSAILTYVRQSDVSLCQIRLCLFVLSPSSVNISTILPILLLLLFLLLNIIVQQ
jgi:hypothetical protein